jgi:hypothetical protein
VVVFLMAGALLTTTAAVTTMVPAAYAGGDNDDGNKQKAEDDSAAAIADCDENEVEQAGFDCIAIAANNVEIETPPETATLSVCKDVAFGEPAEFAFTVTGNGPSPAQFVLGDDDCVDVNIGPGEYTVTENTFSPRTFITGDCVQDPPGGPVTQRATGEIQAGETQECLFRNETD